MLQCIQSKSVSKVIILRREVMYIFPGLETTFSNRHHKASSVRGVRGQKSPSELFFDVSFTNTASGSDYHPILYFSGKGGKVDDLRKKRGGGGGEIPK